MKINVETIVSASIEEVWRAWNPPDDIKQWNSPSEDWHTTKAAVDLRVGGSFSSRMEAKDGSMGFDFAGTYTKIIDRNLIESTFGDRALVIEFMTGIEANKELRALPGRPVTSPEASRGLTPHATSGSSRVSARD